MLDKDVFKQKIDQYISQAPKERPFDVNFVENLYLILYTIPAEQRDKKKRKLLQEEVIKEGL